MRSHSKKISPRIKRKVRLLKTAARGAAHFALLEKYKKRRRLIVTFQSLGFTLVILLSVILQTYLQINPPTYALDPAIKSLVGESRDDASQYLSEDTNNQTYNFSVPEKDTEDASVHIGRNTDAYEAIMPKDARQGIKMTDTASNIDMTLIPKFKTYEGKKVDGDHIVYLASGGAKLIYTLKYNGLKEDIIIPEYRSDELSYTFDLKLPVGVEARLDEQGNIGIYSAESTLFGNVSFGSDDDRSRLEKARESGDKTNLVATIPSPIVKDANGVEYNDKSGFVLGEKKIEPLDKNLNTGDVPPEVAAQIASKTAQNSYELKISSLNLKNLAYPISIDPTIQTSSAADWGKGNFDEGGIEIVSASALIKRKPITGGIISSWTPDTGGNFTTNRYYHATVAYNNHIYVLGGCDQLSLVLCNSNGITSVQYAPINSGGDIGAWSATTNLPVGLHGLGAVAYNGYLYITGGRVASTSNDTNAVRYIKINSDGTLGSSWTATTSFNIPRTTHAYTVHKGYLWIAGGFNSNTTAFLSSSESAPINGDGSVGAWTAQANLPDVASNVSSAGWGEYFYVLGGKTTGGSLKASVYYAKLQSDGTIAGNAWSSTTTFATARRGAMASVISGYLYIAGGCTSGDPSCSGSTTNTQYAVINSDGSVGTWVNTTSLAGALYHSGTAVWQNKMYITGGCTTGAECTTRTNASIYNSIESPGVTSAGTTQANTFPTARMGHGTILANGYIYVMGGCTVDQGSCDTNAETLGNTYYASISSSGTVGSWTAGTNFPTISLNAQTRGVLSAAISGDYIYVMGGSGNCGGLGVYSNACAEVFYASINPSTGAISAWTNSGNPLPAARFRGGATSHNGYIYYLGGLNSGGTIVDTVYYASAGSGANGAWNTTSTLSTPRTLLGATTHAGYLYVGSSYDGSSNPAPVLYAKINTNGTLDAFATTSSVSEIRDGATIQAYNGYLYLAGGFSGSTYRSSIEYAQINNDGTLGSFTSSPNTLVTAGRRYPGTGGIYNGILYIAGGGTTGAGVTNSTESIPINNGGSGNTTVVTNNATTMGTARTSTATVVARGYIYALGGCIATSGGCITATATTEKAAINSDGSIGTWSAVTSISNAVFNHTAITHNDYIYVIGGNNVTTAVSTVEYTHVKSDGTFEAPSVACGASIWCATTSLPGIRSSQASVLYNSYIYNVGGNSSTAVYYIKINSDGTLAGSWTAGTSITSASNNPSVVAQAGYLHVIGSESTPINSSDGSIGTWVAATRLARPQSTSGAYYYNGYIYIPGGTDGADTPYIQYAPILADGKIGNWGFSTNDLPFSLVNARGVYYNGRIYVVGGNTGPTLRNTVLYFGFESIARKGTYSRLIDFDTGVKPTKLITRGTKRTDAKTAVIYKNVSNNGPVFSNTQNITDTGYTGANAQTFNLGTNITLSRYLQISYTIDDTMSAIFPDVGNESTITDYDVYFTANPGQRLRGGRTFTNGVDRGLDAQPNP